MEYLAYVIIGLLMGLFGGLLGIGGSVVIIPALVFMSGENQHLYQASAMICNFFVATTALMVHKKVGALTAHYLKWLIPSAAVGIIVGVAISNSSVFACENSYLLARILGGFMIYAVVYNCLKLKGAPNKHRGWEDGLDISNTIRSMTLTIACGLLGGISAGLLGLGGGIVLVPTQQLLLKMPLKKAISNSAATIAATALIGAFYKNITLLRHDVEVIESLRIAMVVIPGAILGALLGSRLVYKLPVSIVRVVFILFAALASYKLLTVAPAL